MRLSTLTMYKNQHISVIVPAHNEAESIGSVVNDLTQLLNESADKLIDDIIVCDNASSDNTAIAATQAGARVVYEAKAGYGSACLKALAALKKDTDIIVFVDGDTSVNTREIYQLLEPIVSVNTVTASSDKLSSQECAELTIGVRTKNQQEHGALLPQQKLGNILACSLIQRLWSQPVSDLGPFRAITLSALKEIGMTDQRFGWTVEMQVKAIQNNIKVIEVPVSVRKRVGKSKISGTFKGTFLACLDIFGTIFKLKFIELKKTRKLKIASQCP